VASAFIYVSIVGVVFATVWSNVKRGNYITDTENGVTKGYRSNDTIPNRVVFARPGSLGSALNLTQHLSGSEENKRKNEHISGNAIPLAVTIKHERSSTTESIIQAV
jgi:hypothetical protein